MVGGSGGRAAVMGMMPHTEDTDSEIQSFVQSLLEHDRIDLGKKKKKKSLVASENDARPTHAIKKVGNKKVLERIRVLSVPGMLSGDSLDRYRTGRCPGC